MIKNGICIKEVEIKQLEIESAENKAILVDIKEHLKKIEDNQNSFFKWLLTILASVILSLIV